MSLRHIASVQMEWLITLPTRTTIFEKNNNSENKVIEWKKSGTGFL